MGDTIDTSTSYPKILKSSAGYIEEVRFENNDLDNGGYFCYNCTYFIKDKECAIVKSGGSDVNGNASGNILPYGSCDLWVSSNENVK